MSLWSRIKGAVNRVIRGGSELPATPPEPTYQEPIPYTPLPQQEDYGYSPSGGYELDSLVDDWGINRGTNTKDGWYQETLLNNEEFHAKYGADFDNLDMIYWWEEYYDEPWDWESWREDYEAKNG